MQNRQLNVSGRVLTLRRCISSQWSLAAGANFIARAPSHRLAHRPFAAYFAAISVPASSKIDAAGHAAFQIQSVDIAIST